MDLIQYPFINIEYDIRQKAITATTPKIHQMLALHEPQQVTVDKKSRRLLLNADRKSLVNRNL